MTDPEFLRIVHRDLDDGQHRNPTGNPHYFTTAYFHRADELQAEMAEAGLEQVATYGIEGPGWLLADLKERWSRPEGRDEIILAARSVESAPSLVGVSAHVMNVGRKTESPRGERSRCSNDGAASSLSPSPST